MNALVNPFYGRINRGDWWLSQLFVFAFAGCGMDYDGHIRKRSQFADRRENHGRSGNAVSRDCGGCIYEFRYLYKQIT